MLVYDHYEISLINVDYLHSMNAEFYIRCQDVDMELIIEHSVTSYSRNSSPIHENTIVNTTIVSL